MTATTEAVPKPVSLYLVPVCFAPDGQRSTFGEGFDRAWKALQQQAKSDPVLKLILHELDEGHADDIEAAALYGLRIGRRCQAVGLDIDTPNTDDWSDEEFAAVFGKKRPG
jgi:hypothetical protein